MPLRPPTFPITSTASLAKYLDLSEWTVSRAINGHPEVKVATRDRIIRAMEELGFRPNPVARGLNGKKMGIVGVYFANPRNTLVAEKISLLDEFLRSHQYRPLLAISARDPVSERAVLKDFRHLRVDGVVLFQSIQSPDVMREILGPCPSVHIDPLDRSNLPNVQLDRGHAMEMIIDHLFQLGHRSFATLGFSATNPWRWTALVQSLRDRGLNPDTHVQVHEMENTGDEGYAYGATLARRVLAAPRPPTAWIVINDRVAVGAIQALRDAGHSVPKDFSVVGFDNIAVGQHVRPTLTTIDQLPNLIVRQAGEILLRQLNSPAIAAEDHLIILPQLIVRESTGPVPR